MQGACSPVGLMYKPYWFVRKCIRRRVDKIAVEKKLLLKFSFHLPTNKLTIIRPGEGGREREKYSFVVEPRQSTKWPIVRRGYKTFLLTFPFFLRTKRTTSDQPDGWCEKEESNQIVASRLPSARRGIQNYTYIRFQQFSVVGVCVIIFNKLFALYPASLYFNKSAVNYDTGNQLFNYFVRVFIWVCQYRKKNIYTLIYFKNIYREIYDRSSIITMGDILY